MQKNWNVQFKQQDCERVNLDRREVVNSESCSEGRRVEREKWGPIQEVQDYTGKTSKKSKHEQQQEWLRTSPSCFTNWLLVVTQKSQLDRSFDLEPLALA